MKIAILLTCYNRKSKTISCLNSVLQARDFYNRNNADILNLHFILTDDKCTDGTPEAVRQILQYECHTIVQADGNAYWAGGMRLAWSQALSKGPFNFYLLLNDDTIMRENCFSELIDTHRYCLSHFTQGGVYTAFINDPDIEKVITYGAKKYTKGIFSSAVEMLPIGKPQKCTMPNANILLVSDNVCNQIGILSEDYIHSAADLDYGLRAVKAGCPVLTTSNICGSCKKDHDNADEEAKKVIPMSIKKRKEFLNRPTRQYKDSKTFFRKYSKIRYLLVCLSYYINIYAPTFYYMLLKLRGH